MQSTSLTYEKPSWISQGLVICFSIAVVLMAGWLALTIMVSRLGTSSVVDDTDIVTSPPVYVQNVSPEADQPSVMTRQNTAYFEPLSRDYSFATAAPLQSALPLAPLTEAPPVATRDRTYPMLSILAPMPDANYRGIPAEEPLPAEAPVETNGAAVDLVPLPPPPPPTLSRVRGRVGGGTASIPVPRPRPRLEADDVQPAPEQPQSLFDLLLYGQR
jgi:hypothetical protein